MTTSDDSSQRTGNPALVNEAVDRLGLSDDIRATATALYHRVYADDLYHGRTLETVLAGTIYVASRVEGQACNPTTVAGELGTTREDLLSTARHLMRRLDGITPQPIEPEPYVIEYTEALGLGEDLQETALDIIRVCKDQGLLHSGKSPTGFAAGAIYAASQLTGERITQQEISELADVSTVTIRNRYQTQIETYENNTDN